MAHIRPGDEFMFRGLAERPDEDVTRKLTVLDISVGGMVSVRIDMTVDGQSHEPGIASAPLDLALLMIQQGIWEPVQ